MPGPSCGQVFFWPFPVDISKLDFKKSHLCVFVLSDADLEPLGSAPGVFDQTVVACGVEIQVVVADQMLAFNLEDMMLRQIRNDFGQPIRRGEEPRVVAVHQGHGFDGLKSDEGTFGEHRGNRHRAGGAR